MAAAEGGPQNNGVLLVGDALGAEEELVGKPFQGRAGNKLTSMLARKGLKRDQFVIDNAIRCRPPGNKLDRMPYEQAALAKCAPNLDGTVARYRPRVIVPMGDVALQRVLGLSKSEKLTGYRGYVQWSWRYNAWVLPTYHPTYILRGQQKLENVFTSDIAAAVHIAERGFKHSAPKLTVDPPYQDFEAWVDRVLAAPRLRLAYDIETPYKQDLDDESTADMEDPTYVVLRIGFAVSAEEGISIPWSPQYLPAVRRLMAGQNVKLGWNCPTGDQRVLTADLRWVRADSLVVGDKLVGFEEERADGRRTRRYQETTVTHVVPRTAPVTAVHLSDGSIVKVTGEHPWLVTGRRRGNRADRATGTWVRTVDLVVGQRIRRLAPVWSEGTSREHGYLAGFFDGEGCLTQNAYGTLDLSAAQRKSATLDHAVAIMRALGYATSVTFPTREKDAHVGTINVASTTTMGKAAFLGEVRPQRLLDKFQVDWLGAAQGSRDYEVEITAIQDLGEQPIIGLTTTSHTYLVEGFGAHNCAYDHPRLVANGIPINGDEWDLMWAWHVLNSDLPKGLAFVVPSVLRDVPRWKHQATTNPGPYNALDGVNTWRLCGPLEAELHSLNLWRPFERHVVKLDQVLGTMSAQGIPVDNDARLALAADIRRDLDISAAKIQAAVPREVRKLHVYKKPVKPEDRGNHEWTTLAGERETRQCERCGLVDAKKPHVSTKTIPNIPGQLPKRLPNPCLGASLVETTVAVELDARVEPFVVSNQQLTTYASWFKHKVPTNKDGNPTFDEDSLATLIGRYPLDQLYPEITTFRGLDKLRSTYCGEWIGDRWVGGIPVGPDGRVHTTYRHNPSTLRLSSQAPNLQNIPREAGADALTKRIKSLFVAEPGHVIAEADFSAIEAVLVGYLGLAVRDNLADALAYMRLSRLGVHDYFNSHMLAQHKKIDRPADISWSDADLKAFFKDLKARFPVERDVAKRIVHGSNYAATPGRLFQMSPELLKSTKNAAYLQSLYLDVCAAVRRWQDATIAQAAEEGYLRNPFGYIHRFHQVYDWKLVDGRWESSWGEDAKRALAFGPQSTGSGIIKEAMLRIADDPELAPYMRLTVHDSLLFMLPTPRAHELAARVRAEMERPVDALPLDPTWGLGTHLVIYTESKLGPNWGACK